MIYLLPVHGTSVTKHTKRLNESRQMMIPVVQDVLVVLGLPCCSLSPVIEFLPPFTLMSLSWSKRIAWSMMSLMTRKEVYYSCFAYDLTTSLRIMMTRTSLMKSRKEMNYSLKDTADAALLVLIISMCLACNIASWCSIPEIMIHEHVFVGHHFCFCCRCTFVLQSIAWSIYVLLWRDESAESAQLSHNFRWLLCLSTLLFHGCSTRFLVSRF